MSKRAVIVGNSDGIGLALTKRLLEGEWSVTGISRSGSSIDHSSYRHIVARVQDDEYPGAVESVLNESGSPDLCVYCAGIGELLDISDMRGEERIFRVNLMGMIRTVTRVIPAMAGKGSGHFIGISSVADEILSQEAPSYHASKAAFSNYLEGLALAVRPRGVYVTNVRFGFVDTKMAKADVKPFMMTVDKAVEHLLRCMEKKPVRYTAPGIVIPLVKLRSLMQRIKIM
ncbi:MAG: SDR family NAD(P)-dependent oxidoreductase [Candidatus Latescibacteria bacterium]|nr:SDR family NAD(P)-dependent oxidoreductase [bacterium]MBD3425287.1 SDR family NAD(P)-dependent oxidoreductase [Candidatus Latescibacterota bacterium]